MKINSILKQGSICHRKKEKKDVISQTEIMTKSKKQKQKQNMEGKLITYIIFFMKTNKYTV